MSPPSEVLLLFDVVSELEFASPDEAVPVVSPPSSPPEPVELLLASLDALESPPVALELLSLVEFPLPDTPALLDPPFPPVEEAFASPELPEAAVVSPPPLVPVYELFDVAFPVPPLVALLWASPPFALWFCVISPPLELELLFAVVSEEALESPEVALPEVSPELSPFEPLDVFDAELLPDEEPPEAFELLLFVALPLPETFALFEPPLPPCEEALALPELPEVADESPPELVEEALPVVPEVA